MGKLIFFEQLYQRSFIKTFRRFSGKMMVKIFASAIIAERISRYCRKQSEGRTPKFRPEFIN